MEKTICIGELLELIEKNLVKKKNKIEKQINSKSSKTELIHLISFTGQLTSVASIVNFFGSMIFKTIAAIGESVTYSFNNVSLVDDSIVFVTGVPIPMMLVLMTFVEAIVGLSLCRMIFGKNSFNVFYLLRQMEQKIIDYIDEKKHQKLCDTNIMLNNQLSELAWFKENYLYLLGDINHEKEISEDKLNEINKLLEKESLINVFYFLCIDRLNEFKHKYKSLQKIKIKNIIKEFAVQVQEETNAMQQEINEKIATGERVKRIERYHAVESAYDNVCGKTKCLSR